MAILKGHKMVPGEQPDVLSQLLHTLVLTCNCAILQVQIFVKQAKIWVSEIFYIFKLLSSMDLEPARQLAIWVKAERMSRIVYRDSNLSSLFQYGEMYRSQKALLLLSALCCHPVCASVLTQHFGFLEGLSVLQDTTSKLRLLALWALKSSRHVQAKTSLK